MIAKATKYERLLKSTGAGAFGKIEYANETSVILRTGEVKTADLSGIVRIQFDSKREQVVSGRRFDPMGSNLVLMRQGSFYRVYSTVEIVKPIPKGVTAMIVLDEEAADVMMIATAPLREGFIGRVQFTIQPFRRVEMEKMTSVARLVFFEDYVPKSTNSSRSKSRTKNTSNKPKSVKKEESKDESSISDKHPDNPES